MVVWSLRADFGRLVTLFFWFNRAITNFVTCTMTSSKIISHLDKTMKISIMVETSLDMSK